MIDKKNIFRSKDDIAKLIPFIGKAKRAATVKAIPAVRSYYSKAFS